MINKNTGSVSLLGNELKPRTELSSFLTTPLGSLANCILRNGAWTTYSLRDDPAAKAMLVFKDGLLTELRLSLASAHKSTPATWSREVESMRHELHKAALENDLGTPPYAFCWGTVESVFDEKTGESAIILRFT